MTEKTEAKKGKGPLFIGLGVIVAALLGGGNWWWKKTQEEAAATALAAEHASKPGFLTLTPFVITVPSEDRLHHMMLELDLMSHDRAMLAHLSSIQPLVRNRVVNVVSVKDYEKLTSASVISDLEKELLSHLHQLQKETKMDGKLDKVLITKLVIQ